jgi:hypothetical protein
LSCAVGPFSGRLSFVVRREEFVKTSVRLEDVMHRVETQQFRTQLIRELRNLFPEYDPEFIEEMHEGIGFRLKDKKGQYRSEIVLLLRVIKIK